MEPFISFESLKDLMYSQTALDVLERLAYHNREDELLEELNKTFVINEYGYPYTLKEVHDYIAYEMDCSDTWADIWED